MIAFIPARCSYPAELPSRIVPMPEFPSAFSDPSQDPTLRQGRRGFLRGIATTVATTAGCVSLAAAAADAEDKSKAAPAGARVDPSAGLAGIKQVLAGKEPVTWVITGDSITHGA